MNITARAEYVRNHLAALYPHPPIPLHHQDPYTLLIAVILSAQCTDARVNKVTPALFKVAHTPAQMAQLSVQQIHALIATCGLAPTKSRSISTLSQLLVSRHAGHVPRTRAELEALPGVGRKTASVVLSQAFGEETFPVDTHIYRLARRWKLSCGKNTVHVENDLKQLFPSVQWRDLHLQFIYYGREHCTARGCNGRQCPICHYLSREKN